MARGLTQLALALLLALAAHMALLWFMGQQWQALRSVITPQTDPLFTRQITQQGNAVNTVANKEEKKPSPQSNRLSLAAKNIAKKVAQPQLVPTTSTQLTASLPALSTTTDSVAVTTPSLASATAVATQEDDQFTAINDDFKTLSLQGQWPSDTRLTYQLGGYFRGPLHGDAQVQWTRPTNSETATLSAATPSDRYQVRIGISVGLIKAQFTSQGRVRVHGLEPEAYEEVLANGKLRSVSLTEQSVRLMDGRSLSKPVITAQTNNMDQTMLTVQDTASQFVDLGHRFSSGRARLVQGEQVRVWLARPAGLDEWIYDVGPAETIDLPTLGAVQAYHLKPRPLPNARGTIEAQMWIAPSLQYLPVRIKITLNSETHVDLLVKTIEQR
jgi:hypothetical protein